MTKLLAFSLSCVFILPALAAGDEPTMDGKWKIVSSKHNGRYVWRSNPLTQQFVIGDGKIVHQDLELKETKSVRAFETKPYDTAMAARMGVKPGCACGEITYRGDASERDILGIYKIEDDELTICAGVSMSVYTKKGDRVTISELPSVRPTEFETTKGDGRSVSVFYKVVD